jgi:hypothetical protein
MIADVVWTLGTGLGCGAIAWIGGYATGRKPMPPKQPKPICGCGHHLAMHDPQTGACQVAVKTATQWSRKGTYAGDDPLPTHFEYYPCSCRQYIGPKPADVFLAQEVNWDLARMQVQGKVPDDDG